MKIDPVENHRRREKGVIVYPVYSRRSGGLSLGVNLFPDQKRCSFDCPYCEVFPFAANVSFSPERMERELRSAVTEAAEKRMPVKDICFSGNGEPSLAPELGEALERAGRVRGELVPGAALVLITNGSGLLRPPVFELLRDAATGPLSVNIWLKLDAGTPAWYRQMSRSTVPFEKLVTAIKQFITGAPVIIQTMLCAIDGKPPPREEVIAWEGVIVDLALATAKAGRAQSGIQKVQIYGKARPAPEDPKAEALPAAYLDGRAASLRRTLAAAGVFADSIPVEAYP